MELGKNLPVRLYTGNPNKFLVLQHLVRLHESKGHKVLVFLDNIFILKEYAAMLGKPYVCGEIPNQEREKILQFFQHLPDWNVLFISKVGDVGLDLPDANVAIEVSSHFGSRRQETQRLGRILRPKEHVKGQVYDSFFYSVVSSGTEEVKYALKRQKFLIKQGYSFQIKHFEDYRPDIDKHRKELKMCSDKEQFDFLQKLVTSSFVEDNDRGKGLVLKSDELKFSIKPNADQPRRLYVEK